MSSDSEQIFMTGGGENVTSSARHNDPSDPNLSLTRAHLSPTRMSSARQTILGAVETLETENEELRKINNRMLAEMESLRAENNQLRKDLDLALQDRQEAFTQRDSIVEDNKLLEEKLKLQAQQFSDENRKYYNIENSLKQDTDKYKQQYENMRAEYTKRENDVRALSRELEAVKSRLEQASRKNFHDKDVETFHEMEMLKSERKDLIYERDEAQRLSKKYCNEIKKLETCLEQKSSELRNENRRHTLLTKEFNSLLEENNHLKLQLRRRRQGPNSGQGSTSREELAVSESVTEIATSSPRIKRVESSPSLGRELTLSDNVMYVPKLQQRPLLSRERGRQRSSGGSNVSSSLSSVTQSYADQEDTHERGGDKKGLYKKRSSGSRSDSDTSPPPEGLPTIAGGKTWRP